MVRPETDSLGAPSTVIALTGIARPPASVAVRVSCPAGCFSDTAMVSATVLSGPTGQVSVPSAQETVTVSSSAETVTLPGSMPPAASVADSTTDCGVPLAASVVVGSAARPVMPAVTVSGTVCGRRSVTLTVAGPSFAAGAASNENVTSTWAPALIGGTVQFATTTAAGTATANAATRAGPVQLPPWMIAPVRVKPSGSVTSIDSPPVEVEPPVLRTTTLKEPEPPAVTVAPSGTSSSRAAGVSGGQRQGARGCAGRDGDVDVEGVPGAGDARTLTAAALGAGERHATGCREGDRTRVRHRADHGDRSRAWRAVGDQVVGRGDVDALDAGADDDVQRFGRVIADLQLDADVLGDVGRDAEVDDEVDRAAGRD